MRIFLPTIAFLSLSLFALLPLVAQTSKHSPIYNHVFDAYFEEAYATYPSIPRGVLEAIAYTNTRIYHHVPDPKTLSCIGLPPTYGVMGLMENGKNWFRENIYTVAELSGYSVEQLKQSPRDNIMGFAAAFDAFKTKNEGKAKLLKGVFNHALTDKASDALLFSDIDIIRQLSELPYIVSEVQNDFPMNSHLYSVLYHLNLPEFQAQYRLPAYQLDLKAIFGLENYALVSATSIDLSHEYENKTTQNTNENNSPNLATNTSTQEAQQLQVACTMPSGPAEYAPSVAFDEPSDNYSGAITPYTIAIHDMEGVYAGALSWFNNPIADVSAHYCMRNFDGQVTQMVCHRRKAWHVAAENAYAVGIEHEGIAAQGEAWYSQTMYLTSANLCLFIASDIGVNTLQTYDGAPTSALMPLSHTCTKVKGHQMFPNNSHSDPGIAWDWPYFYTLLNPLPAPVATYSTASGTIYDSGGNTGNYTDEERKTWLIQPSGTATNITLTFSSYTVENNYDYLWIYDGNDNTGALIGKYSGTSPGTVTAYSGAMFLEFRSDCATNQAGWAASYTSSTAPATCAIPASLSPTPSAHYCTVTWGSVSGATGYELSWKRSLDATWTTQTLSNTSYIITGLTAGAVYECRVRAICGTGIYSGYKGETFITLDQGLSVTTAGSYTVNQCEGTFKDSGGSTYHYSNYENWTYTIAPTGASSITLVFSSFETEANYDYLYIYNGPTTASPLIGTYHGTTSPGTIVSSGGALTLRFTSDNATTKPGWAATWTCNQSTTCTPSTSIAALPTWHNDDFTTTFTDTDACSSGGLSRFWLVREYNGTEWIANNNIGFFNEDADAAALNAQWVNNSGAWTQASGNITQSTITSTASNLYAPLTTDNTATYLFHTRMRIGGTGTNRRAGFHFFCSDATQSQRGNSYMVYFRPDDDKVQIYEAVANTIGTYKTNDNATIDPNIWYDYKVTYNPVSGLIKVYVDDVLKSQWTSSAPHQSGGFISLRNADSTVDYDFIRVYKSRATAGNQTVTVGTNNTDMVRSQNNNAAENHCEIRSIVLDNGDKWSALATQTTKIDWTIPSTVSVNDGTGADIDLSNVSNQLQANWTSATDVNSDIQAYWYALGTTPGGTDIVTWTNNGNNTTATISSLSLVAGVTYYISIKAQNGAGLYSIVSSSDGISVCVPGTTVNTIAAWQTDDFTTTFTDSDCGVGIKTRFYCITDFDGNEWRGNGQAGYFYDQFASAIHPDWTTATGTWTINSNSLRQSDATQNNTNIYATVQQTSAYTYLYEWDAKISGAGTNRRMGFHLFSDNPSLSERGNSYFVWYRADNDKLQFYKVTANVFEMVLEVNVTVDIDTWQHYALSYNPTNGEVLMFRDGLLLASWTDTAPLTAGTGVSFRTGNSEMWVDNFAVHHSRPSTNGLVSIGTLAADAVRYQSPNPSTAVGKVSSALLNNSYIFAPQDSKMFKVDWTAPSAVVVSDGSSADIDQTTNTTQLQANWAASTDANSGIIGYEYAVGTTSGGTDIVNWTSNGTNTSVTISGLNLNNGTTYYIAVRAQNGVNLYSIVGISDGQMVVLPCAVPTGLSAATTTISSATLVWNSVGNALNYDLRYRPQSGGAWTTLNVGNVLTYTMNSLAACTVYEVQIQSNCTGSTASGYSSSTLFTTSSFSPAWTVPAALRPCDAAINLNSYITGNTGGTFSGIGVLGNSFNPSGLSVGNYSVTYTVGTGCTASETHNITVNESPNAAWSATNLQACSNAIDLNTLVNGTSGGTWSGTGVSGNTFNPSGLTAGNYNVTYTVGTGPCQFSQTNAMTVTPSPSAAWTAPSNAIAPCNGLLNLSSLVNGTTGGTFSGTGVSGNTFNPVGLAVGNYNIVYSVGSGACQANQTNIISVTTSPTAAWTTPAALRPCDAAINLSSYITGTTGGTFSGTGVSGNTFNPSGLAVGNYNVVYSVGSGTCQVNQTNIISITASPTAAWSSLPNLAPCSAAINLSSYITGTSSGTFSGTGVSGNTFNPSGLAVGNYNIVYSVGSGTCQVNQTTVISISASPTATWNSASVAQCSGTLNLNTLLTGTTGGTWSGTGVSGNNFNPSSLTAGNYSLTYTVGTGTCQSSQTNTISVTSSPSAAWTAPTSVFTCSAAINLNGFITGTSGGTFSGTGVLGNVFDPANLSVGAYNITYTIGTGACQATLSNTISVAAAPNAAWNTPATIAPCNTAISLNTYITGTSGGTFSGTGVTSNMFNPSGLAPNNYNVTYTVGTGSCATSETHALTVTASPSATWTTFSTAQCSGSSNLNSYITGTTGGTFSGTGVTSNVFNPSGLTPNNYNVTYTVGTGTCQATSTNAVTVTAAPNANWTTPPNLAPCNAAINLNSYVTGTAGGTFSGTGVSNNMFNPSGLTAGTYNVTYTIGSGSCQAVQTKALTVIASPSAAWTTPPSLATCNSAINLSSLITGTSGGTFSGTGVSGNNFNPSGLTAGNYNIIYSVGLGACQTSQTNIINISAAPSAAWTTFNTVQCSAASNLNNFIVGTSGGTWSGTGVSGNNFNPSGLAAGNYNLTYTVGSGTCQATQSNVVTVTNAPSAAWTAPTSVFTCSSPISLNGFIVGTSGGTFSGNGITNNTFNPSGLTAGTYSITYTVGSGSCQAIQNNNIAVAAAPSAAWTTTNGVENCDANIDLNTLIATNGTTGGTWSGATGVSNNAFSPLGLAPGNYNVTYTVGTGTCQTSKSDIITVSACIPTGIQVKLKLWLQGAYRPTTSDMNTVLVNTAPNLVPLSQPYSIAPWNYSGSESVSIHNLHSTSVDWVLVELRHAVSNALVASQAGLLRSDASVWNIWGGEGLYFNVAAGSYRIVVRHRNHLAVVSANAVSIPTTNPYDFSVVSNIMGGSNQVANLDGNGVRYGLWAGDIDANGIINVADFNVLLSQIANVNQYRNGDINLNRSVLTDDFNVYQPNSSRIGVTLIRY